MVNQLGVPTIFLTLSAADLWWPCLVKHYGIKGERLSAMSEFQISRLMQKCLNENPLIANEYFSRRVAEYMKVLKPYFKIKDYWSRFEWQHRGSPHIHSVIWIEDAPDVRTFDSATPAELQDHVQFYDRLVSAMNPNVAEPPAERHPSRVWGNEVRLNDETQFAQLLNRVQRHTNHGPTCLKGPVGRQTCRFNYPKQINSSSKLEKDDKGIWQFIPKRNDCLLNDHNMFVAKTWRANTDCKIIASENAIINYLSKYAAKGETQSQPWRDLFSDSVSSCGSEEPAKKAFAKTLMKIVGQRDVSACEVMHLLTGDALFHCSRTFAKVRIALDDYVQIPSEYDETVVSPTLFEYYASRPSSQEEMTFKEYAISFHVSQGRLVTCRKQRILQVTPKVLLNQNAVSDETYHKQLLVLNIPWRSIESLKTHATWKLSSLALNLSVWQLSDTEAETSYDEIVLPENEPHLWQELAAALPLNGISDVMPGYREVDRAHSWYTAIEKYPDILEQLNFIKSAKEATVPRTTVRAARNTQSLAYTTFFTTVR